MILEERRAGAPDLKNAPPPITQAMMWAGVQAVRSQLGQDLLSAYDEETPRRIASAVYEAMASVARD